MRPRYLLVTRAAAEHGRALLDGLCKPGGLEIAYSNRRIAAFASPDCPCLAIGQRGCVIGSLFHRHGLAEPVSALDAAGVRAIGESKGAALLDRFWGGYVAAVGDGGEVTILRDPSATFPCYFTTGPGYSAFASDAELLVESGLAAPEIDWAGLASQYYNAGIPGPRTSLRGISELLPGFSIRPGEAADEQAPRWSPWRYAKPHPSDDLSPVERLSRSVRQCVSRWSAASGRLLLSVSGGLDSSIVAACLRSSDAEVICLTMFDPEDPSGDERSFARALCSHLDLPLIERPYRLSEVDIGEPLEAHLPRSKDRTHALAYERAHVEAARDTGAAAFMTGNGGDSIFGYSQSAAPIADRLLSRASFRETAGTTLDVCRQTGCSLLDAVRAALQIARGPRGYRCRPDELFLDPRLLDELRDRPLEHPWLDAPAGVLPGKAAHVASILRVQQAFEPGRASRLAVLNPLASQPIVETALGIPSWEWRRGGIDRSAARRAFAPDLPAAVIERRVKGGPSHFAARVLNRNRGAIRERLLDGHLARQQIIDTEAVDRALDGERMCTDEERVRILQFVASEAWLDSWLARAGSTGLKKEVLSARAEPF